MIFSEVSGRRSAGYLGCLGLFAALVIASYYTYVSSWGLGYSLFSAFGTYFGRDSSAFLYEYTGGSLFYVSYAFYIIVVIIVSLILVKGISRGIEKMVKIAMPLLLIFAAILTVRVLTLGPGAWEGLAYIWRPNWELLSNWNVWLMAAGQIFFTLSLGQAEIPAYASYMGKDDDVAQGPVIQTLLNEICEIVFGGCIAIPAIFFFFGSISTDMTEGYNLAFIAMPKVMEFMPGGRAFGVVWFLLLFIAGFTTIVSLLQPFISFLQDEFRISRTKSVTITIALVFLFSNLPVFFYHQGVFDDMDFWAGSLLLVIVSLLEVILFSLSFGADGGMEELNRGGKIRLPKGVFYIIKYVTPGFLIFLLIGWLATSAPQYLSLSNVYVWTGRIAMVALFALLEAFVYMADIRGYRRPSDKRR
jgi:SNF family Na+-dependent transporter